MARARFERVSFLFSLGSIVGLIGLFAGPVSAATAAEVHLSRSIHAYAEVGPIFDAVRYHFEADSLRQESDIRAVDRERLGRGTWVCSPSGFSKMTSCVLRGHH